MIAAELTSDDIRAIEAATRAAIPPMEVLYDQGWVLSANGGVIGRANSVLPERGHDELEARVHRAERFYADRNLPPKFRLSAYSPVGLADHLTGHGYRETEPTLVMVRASGAAQQPSEVELVAAPDSAWVEVFSSAGKASEGVARVAALTRGSNRFGQVSMDGRTEAVGVIGGAEGWQGLHGMRTRSEVRRKGLARRLATALMAAASRDATRGYVLQVESGNAPAIALYRQLGFEPAWTYGYWVRGRPI